jgi:hypothetical protein
MQIDRENAEENQTGARNNALGEANVSENAGCNRNWRSGEEVLHWMTLLLVLDAGTRFDAALANLINPILHHGKLQ